MSTCARALILFSATAAIAAASPATAAPGGPPIGYALQSGYTFSVFLANPDGSGVVKLYTAASKVSVPSIDMRPGGNELTLEEANGGNAVMKIIDYSDAGVVQSIRTVPNNGCTVQGFDYHPTDGSLLVSRYCNSATIIEVRRYDPAAGAWDTNPLVSYSNSGNRAANGVRWMGDGSGFIWAFGDQANGGRLDRYMLTNTGAPVTIYQTGGYDVPNWFDVARCSGSVDCAKLLVTDQTGQIHLVAFDGTNEGILYSSAADGHFSPDNLHVLWRLQAKGGYQLRIDNSQFLSKGTYSGKDWRQ